MVPEMIYDEKGIGIRDGFQTNPEKPQNESVEKISKWEISL